MRKAFTTGGTGGAQGNPGGCAVRLFQHAVVQLLFAPVGCGLDEGQYQRVRLLFCRRELGLEERRYVEAVRGGFDGADFSLGAAGYYGKSGLHGGPFKLGIDFEVAEEFFGDDFFLLPVEGLEVGAGAEANLGDGAGEFGRVAVAVGDGAGDGVDDDVLRSGIVFGGVGVGDVEHVAGEFDEGVLKSAAGAEEGPVAAAGELDAFEHAVKTFVGTAGRSPEPVEGFEDLFGFRMGE